MQRGGAGAQEEARDHVENVETLKGQPGWDRGGSLENAARRPQDETGKIVVRDGLERDIPIGVDAVDDTVGSERCLERRVRQTSDQLLALCLVRKVLEYLWLAYFAAHQVRRRTRQRLRHMQMLD